MLGLIFSQTRHFQKSTFTAMTGKYWYHSIYDSWMGSVTHSFSKGVKFKCALNKEMKGKENLLIVKKAIVFAIG